MRARFALPGIALLAVLAGCIWEAPAVFTPLLGPTVKSNPTLAVGATQFLTINSSRLGNVYAKNSLTLLTTLSAESITGCPSGYDGCSVYRARYDVATGRWMVLTFGNEDLDAGSVPVSHFYLGVSDGTDLTTTTWKQFVFAMPASSFAGPYGVVSANAHPRYMDFEIADDVVGIAAFPTYRDQLEAQVRLSTRIVINKADLLAGAASPRAEALVDSANTASTYEQERVKLVPVHTRDSTGSTLYFAGRQDRSSALNFRLSVVTGVPDGTGSAVTRTNLQQNVAAVTGQVAAFAVPQRDLTQAITLRTGAGTVVGPAAVRTGDRVTGAWLKGSRIYLAFALGWDGGSDDMMLAGLGDFPVAFNAAPTIYTSPRGACASGTCTYGESHLFPSVAVQSNGHVVMPTSRLRGGTRYGSGPAPSTVADRAVAFAAMGRRSTDPASGTGLPHGLRTPTNLVAGVCPFLPGPIFPDPYDAPWGETEATVDPADPTQVWVAGAIAVPGPSGSCAAGNNINPWKTYVVAIPEAVLPS